MTEGVIVIIFLIIILLLVARLQFKKSAVDFGTILTPLNNINDKIFHLDKILRDEFARSREESGRNSKELRDELSNSVRSFVDQFKQNVGELNELQREKFNSLIEKQSELLKSTDRHLERMREVVESKLKAIQDDNSNKLEKMRQTVDEKLHKTLEERLGKSFQIVSERLEQVQRGLGEMQSLASGVGDLKRVLTNVKTRGSLGEYRLEMILEQILPPEQYEKNVVIKEGSRENVEFAIKLPSKDNRDNFILLPIDSKFPQDKYENLLSAYDTGNPDIIESAGKELERTIKIQAKEIRDKYINPPISTDFAIIFLPFEGLYAEIVKRPMLFESLERDFKISVAGPSTIAAFLHSLQMGFRTLAIEKRSSEVWTLLGIIKNEFGKFGSYLEGVEKNLTQASNKISEARRKSRTIEQKLRGVELLEGNTAEKEEPEEIEIEN